LSFSDYIIIILPRQSLGGGVEESVSQVAVLVAGAHEAVHDAGLLGAVARVCIRIARQERERECV
jgi:hypothetical protein